MKPSLLIVGLGNIGAEYSHTRHNLGFMAIDHIAEVLNATQWTEQGKFKATIAEARIHTFPAMLCKPTTFMNRSGETIQKIIDFYKLSAPTQLLVLYDDIDIPTGEIRIRSKGSAGTHNGVKSIISCLGTEEFSRIRIGIGPKPQNYDLAQWILSALNEQEQTILDTVFTKLPEEIEQYIYKKTTPSV